MIHIHKNVFNINRYNNKILLLGLEPAADQLTNASFRLLFYLFALNPKSVLVPKSFVSVCFVYLCSRPDKCFHIYVVIFRYLLTKFSAT